MPDAPTPAADTPPERSRGGGAKKLAINFFKIAIAVLGIWYVTKSLSWNDTATLRADNERPLATMTFLDDTPVTVLGQSETPAGKDVYRIRFPSKPVKVRVDTAAGPRDVEIVLNDNPTIPGTNEQLGIRHEMDVPPEYFKNDAVAGAAQPEIVHAGLHSLLITASGKWPLVLGAWALLGIPFLVSAIRWRNLMIPQGIKMPFAKCLQLTFVGQFYSIMLPGITGGDLVKIVYAARLTGSKTKSFITIILDRVIGLVALMVIAGTSAGVQVVLNERAGTPDHTLINVFVMIVALLAVLAIGATVYFSHRLRRLVGIEWFVEHFGADDSEEIRHEKMEHLFRVVNVLILLTAALIAGVLVLLRWGIHLPWAERNNIPVLIGIGVMAAAAIVGALGLVLHNLVVARMTPVMRKAVEALVRVDETLHVYRGHFGLLTWAFLISLLSQLTLPLSAFLVGRALGMTAPLTHFLAYVPVAVLAASLPISPPQGFGILDWLLVHFFAERGARAGTGQAFALAQSVRFLPILWNLLGAYWIVTGSYSRDADPAPEPQPAKSPA